VALLAHVTVRPLSGLPFASLGVAVSCTVAPTTTDAEVGATLTEATGACVTVMAAAPLLPSLVAVIVAVPAPAPVTSPVALTVATAVLELVHVIPRPVRGLPLESLGVAVSCTVCPAGIPADAGVTSTDATGTLGGEMVAVVAAAALALPFESVTVNVTVYVAAAL